MAARPQSPQGPRRDRSTGPAPKRRKSREAKAREARKARETHAVRKQRSMDAMARERAASAAASRKSVAFASAGPDSPAAAVAPAPALECPHFPPCAGCPMIPVPYAEQVERKRAALIASLAAHLPEGVQAEAIVHPTVPAPRLRGYRNQARLVFRRMSRGGFAHIGLGLYAPGTHRVLHIPYCRIQPDRLNAVAETFVRIAEEMNLSTYDERSGEGSLRYLALRTDRARKHVLATAIVAEDTGPPLRQWIERVCAAHPEIVGATLHHNPRHSNVLFAGDDVWSVGAERLEDRVGPFTILVSPRSFLQVNHPQAEWIYTQLAATLGGVVPESTDTVPGADAARAAEVAPAPDARENVVLDLYCGVGGIALHLGRPGRLVIGVESSEEAVEDAKRAAHRNGVAGMRFFASDVASFLRDPAAHGVDFSGKRIEAVVLNPPRAGCGPEVMQAVAALRPELVAYVSCRPFSLARDLESLPGYRVRDAWPVDMIPLTDHVESLTVLERTDDIPA